MLERFQAAPSETFQRCAAIDGLARLCPGAPSAEPTLALSARPVPVSGDPASLHRGGRQAPQPIILPYPTLPYPTLAQREAEWDLLALPLCVH